MRDSIFKNIIGFFLNRLFILTAVILLLFYILSSKLFQLQIVEGEKIKSELTATIARSIPLQAQRGSIYDRYGRPLAVNQSVYSVKLDPSITMPAKELNKVLLNLSNLLKENGEAYQDDLPITLTRPYEYTFYGENAAAKKTRWLDDMGLLPNNSEEDVTAEEAMDILKERFGLIDKETENYHDYIKEEDARNIVSLRSKMYLVRYYSYNPVLVAQNVCLDTVTRIEEDSEKYRSVFVDKEALRSYPYGKYLSHIVGYVGKISDSDNPEELAKKGYEVSMEIIGKSGIEKSFEENLKGENGKLTVVINAYGRRVDELSESRIDPVVGDNVFLTIDAELQKEAYEILEKQLTDIIISRLESKSSTSFRLTVKELLFSLVKANNISAKDVFQSTPDTVSYTIKELVLSKDEYADPGTTEGQNHINQIISEAIENDELSVKDAILLLFEQGIITGDEDYINDFKNGRISHLSLIIDKLKSGELTPQMTNVDPCTGSLVVVDVNTGDVLAAPTYPTYDSNDFITNMNQVYPKLLNDPTTPLVNRPFSEPRAPGSTFKMVTAIAALETGIIDKNTRILDKVTFTEAGKPYQSSWNKSGEGYINVEQALERSTNYFFYEVSFRMGNAKQNNKMDSINTLNKYMSLLGFDEGTGVEIGELYKAKDPVNMSSLAKKKVVEGEDADWFDGNTIATSIGQFLNAYPSAVMARYTAALATKGTLYDLHLLNRITGSDGTQEYIPVSESLGDEISESTWNTVHSGMRMVINGSKGTARNIFSDFPIDIAGKTGTAEEAKITRPSHTSFAGFAPYEDPEIAIYVSIPFSDTKTVASPSTIVAKDVISAYYKLNKEPEEAAPPNSLTR